KNRALLEITNAIAGRPRRRPLYSRSGPRHCSPAFDELCKALRRVMTVEWAELSVYEAKEDLFLALSTTGDGCIAHFEPDCGSKREQNSVGWVFESQRPIRRVDLREEGRYADERSLAAAGMRAYIVVPLSIEERCIGAFRLACRCVGGYSEADVEFLSEVAKQLSLAVENVKAYEEIASLKAKLELENTYLQEEIRTEHNFERIVGTSPALIKLLRRVELAAPSDANVLIAGET